MTPIASEKLAKHVFNAGFMRQNVIFAMNWSCLGLSIVLGNPKLAFGFEGMNRSVPIGVGARLPPGTPIGPARHPVEAACPWIARLVASL